MQMSKKLVSLSALAPNATQLFQHLRTCCGLLTAYFLPSWLRGQLKS